MKRYGKIVLEAEKGITFEVSKETSGELIIRALNIATANVYSTNYVNPPIPEGYKHVCGEWNNGTEVKTLAEIAEDSTEWGNHWNTENSPRKVVETGSREEWTQGQNDSSFRGNRVGKFLRLLILLSWCLSLLILSYLLLSSLLL